MTNAAWPKTLLVPPDARRQWASLREALAVRSTPCAAAPDVWHSRRPDDIAVASAACHTCHAFGPCAAYATAASERAGVWAGVAREPRRRSTQHNKEEVA